MNTELTERLDRERRRDFERKAEAHTIPDAPPRPRVRRWVSLNEMFGHRSERWGTRGNAEPECATC